jgi:hypothetical protein
MRNRVTGKHHRIDVQNPERKLDNRLTGITKLHSLLLILASTVNEHIDIGEDDIDDTDLFSPIPIPWPWNGVPSQWSSSQAAGCYTYRI